MRIPRYLRSASGSLSVAALVLVTAAAPAARAEVEVITAPIVHGRVAGASELYATVAIVDAQTGESNCTGTLVAPRVVVTAAHCLAIEDEESGEVTGITDASELVVVAGALDVADATSTQSYAVAGVVVHEGYPNESAPVDVESGAGRYDDIGLLILTDDVGELQSAIIPSVDEALAALDGASSVFVSGYGATSADTDDSGVLYIAELEFALHADAEIVLGGPGQPDTCPGDSGGPAYLLDGAQALLVGTTSRASESAQASCGDGGVYAFAPFYRDWIVANADGLYSVVPTDPTDPDPTDPDPTDPDPTDPDPTDPDPTDPDGLDETDDGSADEGCAGGGSSGALVGLGFLIAGAARSLKTRVRSRRRPGTTRPSTEPA